MKDEMGKETDLSFAGVIHVPIEYVRFVLEGMIPPCGPYATKFDTVHLFERLILLLFLIS